MRHRRDMETFGLERASSENNMNGHADKMDVLSEMSANILNGKNKNNNKNNNNVNNNNNNNNNSNNNNKSHLDNLDDVVNDLKNIRMETVTKNHNNNDNNNNKKNDNSHINNTPQPPNSDGEHNKNDGEQEVTRRKSKRLKKIRIEKKKQRKEARKYNEETQKPSEDKKDVSQDESPTPEIAIESIPDLPHFVNISENIYLISRKKPRNKLPCDCTLTREEKHKGLRGCQEDCLNRMVNIECGSNCPVGKRCANKRFQKKEYAKIIPFKTEMKGWGLMALEDIDVNVFIMEYVGEVIDSYNFEDRVEEYAQEKMEHYYFMLLKKDEIIDSTRKGNITRFINHSCEPNCITQKWVIGKDDRIGFFTIKPIKKGEELTFDYQFKRYGKTAQKCYCGTPSCRGVIGKADSSTDEAEKLQAELENERESTPEELIEEFYQMYHEDGIDNMQAVQDIMKVIVQTDLTNPYLQDKIISVLLSTKVKAYLKLFVDYRCLIFFWEWMKDTKDLSLKIDFLKLLKILPFDNKTILVDNKVFPMIDSWSKNPRKKNENLDDSGTTDYETENNYKIIQELSIELIKNWEALPEAAKIPKHLKIKMRRSDEQKAKNEEETFKKEENDNRRKEIRENLRKSRHLTMSQPSFQWSTGNEAKNYLTNNIVPQSHVPMTQQEYEEQEKAKLLHRKLFEQKIAEIDYAQAMKRYDIEFEQWRIACQKHFQETGQTLPVPANDQHTEEYDFTTIVSEQKNQTKREKLDFLLEPFENLNIEDDNDNNELEEGLSFIDFNDSKFSNYRSIYDHRTIIIKSDFDELLNTEPNLTIVKDFDSEFQNNQTLPAEYIDIAPIKDITYQSDDIFESMDKTIFDATYPYQGAYINLNCTQYMQGIQDVNGLDIVCKEILAQPLPISFSKTKLPKVPRPWRIRRTDDNHYFYYNPIKMFTQWSHPLVDPSENVSLNDIENVLNGIVKNTKPKVSSEEQLRRNKVNNSAILKKAEQRTKERLQRQKKKQKEAAKKKEEEQFRLLISKYVVKCLNPHLSTKDKKRKIQSKEEFKKIAEKFTNRVVETEISAHRNSHRKLSLTEVIKNKIKLKVKEYLRVK